MTSFSKEIEARILITYLKLTSGPRRFSPEQLAKEALVSMDVVRALLLEVGLGDEPGAEKRVKAALRALELGVEGERVARYLEWREFEELAAEALERAGYRVYRDLQLKAGGRRHQIDLAAWRGRMLLVVDCKHWAKPPAYSERRAIAEAQERRLSALATLGGEPEMILIR